MSAPPLKIVFMGTPEFAAAHLEHVLRYTDAFDVRGVYTQPDRPRGRSRKPSPTPVKQLASERGIPVIETNTLKTEASVRELEAFQPDCLAIVAFGLILTPEVLAVPRYGAVNLHASLLPRHRGPSPIHQTLLEGDTLTGVTTFFLDRGVDTGPILFQKETPVHLDDDFDSLNERLCRLGCLCLVETLNRIRESGMQFRGLPQKEQGATRTHKIRKEHALLDFSKSSEALHNQVRALNRWPGCRLVLEAEKEKMRLRLFRTRPVDPCDDCPDTRPGSIGFPDRKTCHIRTGRGCLELLEIQPEGKKRMSAVAFLNGHRITGDRVRPA